MTSLPFRRWTCDRCGLKTEACRVFDDPAPLPGGWARVACPSPRRDYPMPEALSEHELCPACHQLVWRTLQNMRPDP